MTHDPDKRRMLSEAQLDALLDTSPERTASADLMRRVAQIPIEHPRNVAALDIWPFASLWRALGAAVLAVGLGALSGVVVIPDQALGGDFGELQPLDGDDGWDLDDLDALGNREDMR